jgi:hypothetical protein
MAMLSASVPPEVKINSDGWQFNHLAILRRDVSIKAFASLPNE